MTIFPAGSFAGGYHLETFSERYTNQGAEASMTFIGPSKLRFALIGDWFPRWSYVLSGNVVCCASLIAGSGPQSYAADFLWPDTFTVEPFDDTCTPEVIPGSPPAARLSNQLFFSNGQGHMDGVTWVPGDDCAARVTINFRAKHHASWPQWLIPCQGEEDFWLPPIIPPGTYIEARPNPAIDTWRPDGQTLEFDVQREFFNVNTVDPVPTENCVQEQLVTGDQAAADKCGAEPLIISDAQTIDTEQVLTQQLEVRWSGVPVFNRSVLSSMEGKVNNTVWLGYPPEAVRLSGWDVEEQPYFSRESFDTQVALMTLVLNFDIKMARVDTVSTSLSDEELLSRGVYRGRVGLWNRAWSNTPMYIEGGIGPEKVCLNWVPVLIKGYSEAGCCDTSKPIHLLTCFDEIFEIPSCPP